MDLKRTHCPLGGLALAFAILLLAPWVIQAKTAEPEKGKRTAYFSLTKIKGRDWLLTPEGKPFFAHGITHARNLAKLDFKKFSEACKDIGFNAYGYGCPQQLREDMPLITSSSETVLPSTPWTPKSLRKCYPMWMASRSNRLFMANSPRKSSTKFTNSPKSPS